MLRLLTALWATIAIAACGIGPVPSGGKGARGKADESRPLNATGEEAYGWVRYRVDERVPLGADGKSREALIRLVVPRDEGQPVVAAPRVKLSVRLRAEDELTDDNFVSILYHDYYLSGPDAGTHKYQIELLPSRAEIKTFGTHQGRTRHDLSWRVGDVVGDPDNSRTWAVSLTSQRYPEVGQDASIYALDLEFKDSRAEQEGEWYAVDFIPGSGLHPYGYRLLEEIEVPARAEPRGDAPDDLSCPVLPGDTVDSEGEVAARSKVTKHKALQEFSVADYDPFTDQTDVRLIAAGDVVEQLIELGDGYCRVRHRGVEFAMRCPSWLDEFATISSASGYEAFFNVWCGEDQRGWVSEQDLQRLQERALAETFQLTPEGFEDHPE